MRQKILMLNKIFSLIIFLSFTSNAFAQINSTKISNSEINSNYDGKITTDKIDGSNFSNTAILQGLNKITAKTSEFEVKVGGKIEFGKLTILVHKCWQAPLDESPESKILLEIFETNVSNVKNRIFYGWMFASSPSISSLEHPIYDVIALGCKSR